MACPVLSFKYFSFRRFYLTGRGKISKTAVMDTRMIELLAPARDAKTAITAIECGADAVYIGAPRFGARQAAGSSLDDIRRVVEFAHPYYVKVYAALNTLLYDEELAEAEKIIRQLYDIGVDGVIVQDAGLLDADLPAISLIASTQMNNDSTEKVKFLEGVGFSRAILARELTLSQIREIRKHTSIELECFIHGALCVGASGQCYLSYAIGGRSGNRGVCAQPCRRIYTLKDKSGGVVVKNRYLLSLKDLNLSGYLEEMIDAGVCAFKIEGRLKDASYVANTVGFYRQKLDAILAKKGLRKSSSGGVRLNFTPDLGKTFNRGYTDYGIAAKCEKMGAMDTPKSVGEFAGVVSRVDKGGFVLDGKVELHNGDGICFFDTQNNLGGTVVNGIEGRKIKPQKMEDIRAGMKIYRNYDHAFNKLLEKNPAQRKILIWMVLRDTNEGVSLTAKDEDGNEAIVDIKIEKIPAQKKDAAMETIRTQLKKLGGTIFECVEVRVETPEVYFFAVSAMNELRRAVVGKLLEAREQNRPRKRGGAIRNAVPYPEKHLSYRGNVLNTRARAFYLRHGVETIDPAAETGLDLTGGVAMTTKYCLRRELGLCDGAGRQSEAMILEDEDGQQFEVKFRCGPCGMEIVPK
ncbi:MAG: U32 family peptidase [Planctomycetes bacterium]|nr:U32 family peptidase [Planctomycetota bacterium]